jgi:hypothetical protein
VKEDVFRIFVSPITQHNDVVPVARYGGRPLWLDHQWAIEAELLLKAGVAVVPVCTGLSDLEFVDEGLVSRNAGKGHARHAIHGKRNEDAMPVDRSLRGQCVGDPQRYLGTLFPTQDGRRN